LIKQKQIQLSKMFMMDYFI